MKSKFWKIFAKAIGPKEGSSDKEADLVTWTRIIIFIIIPFIFVYLPSVIANIYIIKLSHERLYGPPQTVVVDTSSCKSINTNTDKK